MTHNTAQSFQCPSCGAPIIPSGNSAVISCPYCHNSVIVPESLRPAASAAPWTTFLAETFITNDNQWLVGSFTNDFFTPLRQVVADGRYRWDAQVGQHCNMSTAWLGAYRVGDFDLAVIAKHIVGSKTGSSWGVIFRIQDIRNFYWFRVTDNQLFAVSVVDNGQWRSLVDWTRSSAIKPNGVNQLEVMAHEAHFILSINGQVVSEIDDETFSQGMVGLAIEGYTVGEKTVFDFLDVTLRAP